MLTISPCPPLNCDSRHHKQTNRYVPASLRGCLSAQKLILIVDSMPSVGRVGERRTGKWDFCSNAGKTKHGTADKWSQRWTDETLLTDKAEIWG